MPPPWNDKVLESRGILHDGREWWNREMRKFNKKGQTWTPMRNSSQVAGVVGQRVFGLLSYRSVDSQRGDFVRQDTPGDAKMAGRLSFVPVALL